MRLELTRSKLTLVSDNPDLGKAKEEIEIEGYDGSDLTIAFNSKYVMEILSVLSGEKVALLLNEALSPGLIREHQNEGYLFVVMPMRL
jgi:DNA polymerase-3 subunit beta